MRADYEKEEDPVEKEEKIEKQNWRKEGEKICVELYAILNMTECVNVIII